MWFGERDGDVLLYAPCCARVGGEGWQSARTFKLRFYDVQTCGGDTNSHILQFSANSRAIVSGGGTEHHGGWLE